MNYYFGFAVSGFSHTRATSKRKQATDETKIMSCQCKSLYNSRNRKYSIAPVAQLVERRSHNPEVVSSILIWGIDFGYGVPIRMLRGNHAELVHNRRLMVRTLRGSWEPTSELRLLACCAFLAVTRSFYERFGRNLEL